MIKLLRPLNLFILAITQLIVYYLFIVPYHDTAGIPLQLDTLDLFLLILAGVLLAATGYVINDYYDHDVDKISKTKFQFENTTNYLVVYTVLHILGLGSAVFLALRYGNISLSILYIAAAVLLYLYSYRLKSTILAGNVLVSVFTVLSIAILLIAEWPSIQILKDEHSLLYKEFMTTMVAFMVFCFLINLARELIKDVEDMQADAKYKLMTFPVKYGIGKSRSLILFFLGLLSISILYWSFQIQERHIVNFTILNIILLILPCIYLIFRSYKAKVISDYSSLSKLCKLNMLFALIYLILV